jgi:NADP-dependent 3-hydroxy acid dehydrogenase YdfG
MNKETLCLVTGATGEVGREFVDQLAPDYPTVALARRPIATFKNQPEEYQGGLDFMDAEGTKRAIGKIINARRERISRIVLIHPVGNFKYEDRQAEEPWQMDPVVHDTNVTTFENVARALMEVDPEIAITMVMLASVTDQYDIPMFRSYREANAMQRALIRKWIRQKANTSGVSLDLGTIDVKSENDLRPNANRKFWLSAEELVKQTCDPIMQTTPGKLTRVELLKAPAGIDPHKGYYPHLEKVMHNWQAGMSQKLGAPIPPEIASLPTEVRRVITAETITPPQTQAPFQLGHPRFLLA